MINKGVKENSPCFKFLHQILGEDLVGVRAGIGDDDNIEGILNLIKPRLYFMIDPYRIWGKTNKSQKELDQTFLDTFNKFRHYSSIIMMRESSYKVAKRIPNNLDFVYIDGIYEYDARMLNLDTWYPKIVQGGVLCGNNYNYGGVKKAIKDFADKKDLTFMVSDQSDLYPPEFFIIRP